MDNAPTELQPVSEFRIHVERVSGFEFRVSFDKEQYDPLMMDEPAPLGKDSAPNPARILAAAIGDCLSASLLFCAQKSHIDLGPVRASVRVQLGRNPKGRIRISKVDVEIDPVLKPEDRERARRCLEIFEDFCIVTQSVREGVAVNVAVKGLEQVPSSEQVL